MRITSRKSPVGLAVRGPELQLRRLQHRAQRQDPGREALGATALLLPGQNVSIPGLASAELSELARAVCPVHGEMDLKTESSGFNLRCWSVGSQLYMP